MKPALPASPQMQVWSVSRPLLLLCPVLGILFLLTCNIFTVLGGFLMLSLRRNFLILLYAPAVRSLPSLHFLGLTVAALSGHQSRSCHVAQGHMGVRSQASRVLNSSFATYHLHVFGQISSLRLCFLPCSRGTMLPS